MKWWIVVLALFLAGCSEAPQPVGETQEIAEQRDFLDTNGVSYTYDELRGGWLVVNYWATWCAPCIKEIPELIALGENHDDIRVFGVNFDAPPPEEAAAQIAKMKITFPVYAEDPSAVLGIDMPQVLPTTVVVDPEGAVKEVLIGPQDEQSLLAVIRG